MCWGTVYRPEAYSRTAAEWLNMRSWLMPVSRPLEKPGLLDGLFGGFSLVRTAPPLTEDPYTAHPLHIITRYILILIPRRNTFCSHALFRQPLGPSTIKWYLPWQKCLIVEGQILTLNNETFLLLICTKLLGLSVETRTVIVPEGLPK